MHHRQPGWRCGALGQWLLSLSYYLSAYNEGLKRVMAISPRARRRSTVLVLRARLHAALQCGVSCLGCVA